MGSEMRRDKRVGEKDPADFFTLKSFPAASEATVIFTKITTCLLPLDFLWKMTFGGLKAQGGENGTPVARNGAKDLDGLCNKQFHRPLLPFMFCSLAAHICSCSPNSPMFTCPSISMTCFSSLITL